MEVKNYQLRELQEKGAIYFERIQQGFSEFNYRSRKLDRAQAVEYLRILWKRNGEENSFVDFYYGGLQEEEKEKVRHHLTREEIVYLENIRSEEKPVFLKLDEKLLSLCTKLNEREMLFSTFYFTKYPCTLWGNFGKEYIEFYPQKRKLEAVLFDMDGLMFDTERIVKRSWDEAGTQMGYGKLGDHIFQTLGMNLKRRGEYFRGIYGEQFPFEKFTEIYRGISRGILEREGVPVKEGLIPLLDYLKQKGYLCAVATSSSHQHAMGNLEKTGIASYFQTVISGDCVTRSKPHPEIYQKTLKELRVEAGASIVLEDSRNGLLAGLEAGTMPIMIPDLLTDIPELEPYLEGKMKNLNEVISYLENYFEKR